MNAMGRLAGSAWVCLLALGALGAQAAPRAHAYRCAIAPTEAASASYSQLPCPAAEPVSLAQDARSTAQRKQALQVAERDGVLSRRMARERQHAERVSSQVPARALTRPAKTQTPHAAAKAASQAQAEAKRQRRKNLFNTRVPKPPSASASTP